MIYLRALAVAGTLGVPIASQNLLQNPSFEEGVAGWEAAVGATVVPVGAAAAEGMHVLQLEILSEEVSGFVVQGLALEPDREYELSFHYQRSFAETNHRLPVVVGPFDPFNLVARPRLSSASLAQPAPLPDEWNMETVRFFGSEMNAPIQVGPTTYPKSPVVGGKVWLDDFSLTPLATFREAGVDHDYIATLPSDAVVGEAVDLHLASLDIRPDQGLLNVRDLPVEVRTTFSLAPSDALTTLERQVTFDGERHRSLPATFHTPGIHRVEVQHTNGHTRLSNPVRVHAEPPPLRHYWGDVHIHTAYNHAGWIGADGYENYWFARDMARLDFAALSEHYPVDSALPFIRQMSDATELYYEPGRFVTFFATEGGGVQGGKTQGHHNQYLRSDDRFDMADPREQRFDRQEEMEAYYDTVGVPLLNVPHHTALRQPTDWRLANRDVRRLIEIYSNHGSSEVAGAWWRHPDQSGIDYSSGMGTKGHDFLTALDRGHRLGVIGSSDDHKARPGFSGLTCAVVDSLERNALWDALHARDCYATSGARMIVEFSVNGHSMGSEVLAPSGQPLIANVRVHGSATLTAIEIVSEGVVVKNIAPGTLDVVATGIALGTFSGESTHYYLRAIQADEHRAWSSPIWIDEAQTPELALEHKDFSFDHGSGALSISCRNYGDVAADTTVRLFSSETASALARRPLDDAEPVVVVRAEPIGADRARLEVYLYLPNDYNAIFDFAGSLQVVGGGGITIVTDPRDMLTDNGNGAIVWDDGPFGFEFDGLSCYSGRVSDFAVEIATLPSTVVVGTFSMSGVPVSSCFVGDTPSGTPGSVTVPLGTLAGQSLVGETHISISPGSSTPVVFPGLSPGHTYVATLDPDGLVVEQDERNNTYGFAAPDEPVELAKWTDIPNPVPLPALRVDPKTAGMGLDGSVQLRATALYDDGRHTNATYVAEWVPDEHFGQLVTLHEGRVTAGEDETSVRVHATLVSSSGEVRSNDALLWASDDPNPVVLTAGYDRTYLYEDGWPASALTVRARIAQRDDFANGLLRARLVNLDGSYWTPSGFVSLADNGTGADGEPNDGLFTATIAHGVTSATQGFEIGDNLKALDVRYETPQGNWPAEGPWPYITLGSIANPPLADAAAPGPTAEFESYLGARIVSAGTRGITQLVGGLQRVFLEVEVSQSTDPTLGRAPVRVIAMLPWQPAEPFELAPSAHSDDLFYLDALVNPALLPTEPFVIDVRAEIYFPIVTGWAEYEWWSSDWWPRLRLHDYTPTYVQKF